MPARTGLSSISFVEPILPRPSARNVPRCRSDWPILLLTWVSLSFGIECLFHGRRLVGEHLADLLSARLRHFLRTAPLAQHVADAAELEHSAHTAAGDHAGTGRGGAQQDAGGVEPPKRLVRDRLTVLRHGEHVLARVVDGLRD